SVRLTARIPSLRWAATSGAGAAVMPFSIRARAFAPEYRCREERMDRRRFIVGSAAGAAAFSTATALAQDAYPSRPITIINPFPPGGAADVVARPFAAILEPRLKQPVVIETKAGAAGQVGAQFAAAA